MLKISGPVNFRIIKFNGRTYYLISDIHDGFNKVYQYFDYDVNELIDKIISHNCKDTVDIFIETGVKGNGPYRLLKEKSTSYIDSTIRYYHDYLYDNELYDNARFHCTDIRQSITQGKPFTDIISNLMNISRKANKKQVYPYLIELFVSSDDITKSNIWRLIKIIIESNNYVTDITTFLNEVLVINPDISDIYLIGQLNKYFNKIKNWGLEPLMIRGNVSLIKKQLDNLVKQGSCDIFNKLIKYIYGKISYISFSNIYNGIYDNSLLHVSSHLMDLYTIARILRTSPYNLSNKGKHYNISKYIVIYEGIAHIDNVAKFLQLIGGKTELFESSERNNKYVVIPDIF